MENKDVQVTCPCCSTRIVVDVRTGRVLRSTRPQEVDEAGKPRVTEEDWKQANSRVESRISEAQDKFDAGLARQKNRSTDLDDLFRKANEKTRDDQPQDD